MRGARLGRFRISEFAKGRHRVRPDLQEVKDVWLEQIVLVQPERSSPILNHDDSFEVWRRKEHTRSGLGVRVARVAAELNAEISNLRRSHPEIEPKGGRADGMAKVESRRRRRSDGGPYRGEATLRHAVGKGPRRTAGIALKR